MIINYCPSYRFKNDKTGDRPTAIKLKRYRSLNRREEGNIENINLEEKLCPVKSIEIYLKATKSSHCNYLFVNPSDMNRPLTSRQAASLVQSLVLRADPHAVFSIRDMRSFASSCAWLQGASWGNILSSCHWATARSFINTYFNPAIGADGRLNCLNTLA